MTDGICTIHKSADKTAMGICIKESKPSETVKTKYASVKGSKSTFSQ